MPGPVSVTMILAWAVSGTWAVSTTTPPAPPTASTALSTRFSTARLQQLGEVLEDDDRARVRAFRPTQRGGRGEQRERRAAPPQVELLLDAAGFRASRPLDERHDVLDVGAGENLLEELADGRLVHAEHARGGPVDGREPPERVERHDATRERLEH